MRSSLIPRRFKFVAPAGAIALSLLAAAGCGAERKSTTQPYFVIFEAQTRTGELAPDAANKAEQVMRRRLSLLGVPAKVSRRGTAQVVVEFEVNVPAPRSVELLGAQAELEFFDLQANLVPPSIDSQGFPVATTNLYELLTGEQDRVRRRLPTAVYLFSERKRLLAGPQEARWQLVQEYRREHPRRPILPKGRNEVLAVPRDRVVIECSWETAVVCPGVGELPKEDLHNFYYLFKYDPASKTDPVPELTGGDLKLDGTRQDFDPNTSQPIVLLSFTKDGRKKFHTITREEAVRGKLLCARLGSQVQDADQCNQNFAIVLDRELRSYPSIDWRAYPDGIDPVNGAQITGMRGLRDAKDLAIVLQTGALPVKFVTVEQGVGHAPPVKE